MSVSQSVSESASQKTNEKTGTERKIIEMKDYKNQLRSICKKKRRKIKKMLNKKKKNKNKNFKNWETVNLSKAAEARIAKVRLCVACKIKKNKDEGLRWELEGQRVEGREKNK